MMWKIGLKVYNFVNYIFAEEMRKSFLLDKPQFVGIMAHLRSLEIMFTFTFSGFLRF